MCKSTHLRYLTVPIKAHCVQRPAITVGGQHQYNLSGNSALNANDMLEEVGHGGCARARMWVIATGVVQSLADSRLPELGRDTCM